MALAASRAASASPVITPFRQGLTHCPFAIVSVFVGYVELQWSSMTRTTRVKS